MQELLDVQAIDTAIDQLRHAFDHHPLRERIASGQAAGNAARRQLGDAEARLHEVRKRQKGFEDEAALVEDKATEMNNRLYAGGHSIRELEALQADVDSLRRRQSQLEDKVLEQMELAEPIDEEVRTAREQLDQIEQAVLVASTELDAVAAEHATRDAELQARRAEASVTVSPALLATYDTIRGRLGGVGVARLEGNRCTGCHLGLSAVDIDQIRKAGPDAEVLCPECGRLLVRSSPSA